MTRLEHHKGAAESGHSGVRAGTAAAIAFVFSLVSGAIMRALLVYTNLPTICGAGPEAWGFWVERVVFAPTIWVTLPLGRVLARHGLNGVRAVITLLEVVLLSAVYGVVLYSALRGHFRSGGVWHWVRSHRTGLLITVAAMVVISVAARVTEAKTDFRREIRSSAQENRAVITPDVWTGKPIELLSTHRTALPSGDERRALVARKRSPLVLRTVADPERELARWQESRDVRVYEIHDGALVHRMTLREVAAGFTSELIADGPTQPGARSLVSLTTATRNRRVFFDPEDVGRGDSSHDLRWPVDFPVVHRTGGMLWTVGFGFSARDKTTFGADELRIFENPVWAGKSIEIHIMPETGGESRIAGFVDGFGDHGYRNIDSTLDSAGVLHIAGVSVLLADENRSRVHYLRFDTRTSKWLGQDVVHTKNSFTSTSRVSIVRSGLGVPDIIWKSDSGADRLSDDGLYAFRIGEDQVTHLARHRDGFREDFALLPEATGPGSTLVAYLTQESRIQWFLRDVDRWWSVGRTELGTDVFRPKYSRTPLPLWRGRASGQVCTAFVADGLLHIQALQLPPDLVPMSEDSNLLEDGSTAADICGSDQQSSAALATGPRLAGQSHLTPGP